MPIALKTVLILNFVVEGASGLSLMMLPTQTAQILYPQLEANALALKFARTTGTAILVLGLLSILPLTERFRVGLPLVLSLLAFYHLLATAHNALLLVEGGGSWLPAAAHLILLSGFAFYGLGRMRSPA